MDYDVTVIYSMRVQHADDEDEARAIALEMVQYDHGSPDAVEAVPVQTSTRPTQAREGGSTA